MNGSIPKPLCIAAQVPGSGIAVNLQVHITARTGPAASRPFLSYASPDECVLQQIRIRALFPRIRTSHASLLASFGSPTVSAPFGLAPGLERRESLPSKALEKRLAYEYPPLELVGFFLRERRFVPATPARLLAMGVFLRVRILRRSLVRKSLARRTSLLTRLPISTATLPPPGQAWTANCFGPASSISTSGSQAVMVTNGGTPGAGSAVASLPLGPIPIRSTR